MPMHTCSYFPRMRSVRQSVVVYISIQCTLGFTQTCIAQRGGAHVSPDVLAYLRSTIASMKAVVHAHVPWLVIVRYQARAVKKRRWCTGHVLNTPPAVVVHLASPMYKHLLKVLVFCRVIPVIFSNIYMGVQYLLF